MADTAALSASTLRAPGDRAWHQSLEQFDAHGRSRSLSWLSRRPQAQLRASQATATPYNLLIVPYETLHSDVHWLASQQWLYMVLDEGHIITNSQAKTTLSVKRVPAKHR